MRTSALRSPPRCRSTSATREVPGSAAATKTPTAWSASTSQEEPTSRASPKRISMRLPCDSINVRERPWASKPQPINYKRCCTDRLNSQPGSRSPTSTLSSGLTLVSPPKGLSGLFQQAQHLRLSLLRAAHATDNFGLSPGRQIAVASEGCKHAAMAEILAPSLELFRGLAQALAEHDERVPQSMGWKIRQMGGCKGATEDLPDRISGRPVPPL